MNNPDDRNAMMVRKLAMQASMLNHSMAELWQTYQALFDVLDLDDETAYDKACDAVMELDTNLSAILGEIREQQNVMCGFFEPRPDVEGLEDFESTVLRGLAGLDKEDLSVYDIRDKGWDDPEDDSIEHIRTRTMTPEEMIAAVRKQYYG